jgi:hypothetical protein
MNSKWEEEDERLDSIFHSSIGNTSNNFGGQGSPTQEVGLSTRLSRAAFLDVVVICCWPMGNFGIIFAVPFLLGRGCLALLGEDDSEQNQQFSYKIVWIVKLLL